MKHLPMDLYWPLVVLGGAYVLLVLIGRTIEGSEEPAAGTKVLDAAYGFMLLASVYALVLVVIALVSYPKRTTDMVEIIGLLVAFFAALVALLYLLTEVLLPRVVRLVRGLRGSAGD